ncbi:MAG: hypothetical protein ACO1N0_16375 [Fluviicola sp.]
MKKIINYSLSLAFLALGMASCAKSNKGKVTNEWKIVSYLKNDSFSNQGSQSGSNMMNMTETTFTQHLLSSFNGTVMAEDSHSGIVNSHELILKKDGTWSLIEDLTHDYDSNVNSNTRQVFEQTGTWTFVGKTKGDDFKKNERLLFNVLTEKKTSTYTDNDVVVSQYSMNHTYLTGENVLIYTIKESKKKEMELELVNDVAVTSNYGSNPGTNTDKLSINMTLKQK